MYVCACIHTVDTFIAVVVISLIVGGFVSTFGLQCHTSGGPARNGGLLQATAGDTLVLPCAWLWCF